jgi:hypothetical protein
MTNLSVRRVSLLLFTASAICLFAWLLAPRANARQAAQNWTFVVSGDARNCGDLIAPAIAETARKVNAAFYLHLGDLRSTFNFDEDMVHQPEHIRTPMTVSTYLTAEWPDFIDNQIAPFGALPYFLGIGNHELIAPKTREEYLLQFADWLDAPVLREQRLTDDPKDRKLRAYFRWIDRGVSFYFLDNASNDMLDAAQLRWFERALAKDNADASITTIVVGMHKPLPDGYNTDHSMNESATSTESGRRVYADLLKSRNTSHKKVYVLASHQHFYMPNAYDTPYWREHGGVLPGWVVGTGGATRYELPKPSPAGAITNTYGALVATVKPGGDIAFEFHKVAETDVPAAVTARYGAEFVRWCFVNNTNVK